MILNILWIIFLFIFFVLLGVFSFFLVIYAILTEVSISWSILKDSLKLSISKKSQKECIEKGVIFINQQFKEAAEDIVQMKDRDLGKKIDANVEQTKKFKKYINDILKDNGRKFISEDDLWILAKRKHSFNFFKQVESSVEIYSNPKMRILKNANDNYQKGQITDDEFKNTISDLTNKNTNQIKLELKLYKMRNKKRTSLFPQFTPLSEFFNDGSNISTLYKAMS